MEHLAHAPIEHAQDAVDSLLELADPEDQVRDDIAVLAARPTP